MNRTSAALATVALAFALTACSDTDSSSESTSKSASRTSEPAAKKTPAKKAPSYDGKAYAAKVEESVETNLGGPIADRCKPTDPAWHCYFDSYTSPAEGQVNVNLSFPGDVDDSDKDAAAEAARLHTFNFAGMEMEDLRQVVSYNDGVDSGTTRRADVPLLN